MGKPTSSTILQLTPCGSISDINGKTPFEMLYGDKSCLTKMRIFCCLCFVHVPLETRTKEDPNSLIVIMVGYGESSKGHKICVPSSNKILISQDVTFDDSKLYMLDHASNVQSNVPKIVEIQDEPSLFEEDQPPIATTPRRTSKARVDEPMRLTYYEKGKQVVDGIPPNTSSFAFFSSFEEPCDIEEALNSKEWCEEMLHEYDALMEY